MKIVLPVLWTAVASLCAQSLENVMVKLIPNGDGAVWEISGIAPGLPSNTLLISQLKYQDPIGKSVERLRVRQEGFQCRYDFSRQRVLSGEYTLVISYQPQSQSNSLEHAKFAAVAVEKKFYHAGGAAKEMVASDPPPDFYYRAIREARQSHRECLSFLKDLLARIDSYNRELQNQTQLYLSETSRDKAAEVEAWIGPERKDGMHLRYLALREEYEKKLSQVLAVPVHERSLAELHAAMRITEQMWRLCLYQLSGHYQFAVLRRYGWSDDGSSFTACCESYRNEIAGHSRSILQREPYPENLGIPDLEQDLLWFNTIYRDLSAAYRGNQGLFDVAKWQVHYDGAKAELDAWHELSSDYEKSPLAKNAEVMARLKDLEKNGRELANIYDSILHQTTGAGQAQKFENGLRDTFAALTGIIDKPREEARIKSEKIAAETRPLVVEFFDVEGEFYRFWQENRRLTPEQRSKNFAKWSPEYKKRLAAMKSKLEKSPLVSQGQSQDAVNLLTSLEQLKDFLAIYKLGLSSDKDPLGVPYLEFHQQLLDRKPK